ncbi:MAG TPA: phosphoheptose isomerase [Clostridiales bacterium]|nr:phosphoheptose isomerase [Clostridiales bacterium]
MDKLKAVITSMLGNTPALSQYIDSTLLCAEMIIDCYKEGNKVLLCGNGGSCADCDHIAGELMKGFLKKRPLPKQLEQSLEVQFKGEWHQVKGKLQQGLPAISLCTHNALMTAFCNDVDADLLYAQQVIGYGKPKDVLIALSTSGNSINVINAVKTSKALDLTVIGFTGRSGGQLKELCDLCLCVPADETYKVQEYHLPIYHAVCAAVEAYFFSE